MDGETGNGGEVVGIDQRIYVWMDVGESYCREGRNRRQVSVSGISWYCVGGVSMVRFKNGRRSDEGEKAD